MYRYIISTFIASSMIAIVFLAWAPEGKGQPSNPDPDVCCQTQLDMADCFCSSIFGGETRQVPCKSSPECVMEGCLWDCNIGPKHCRWYERGKVLQKFIPFTLEPTLILCSACTDCGGCSYNPCGGA
jgi:hypothetical protein